MSDNADSGWASLLWLPTPVLHFAPRCRPSPTQPNDPTLTSTTGCPVHGGVPAAKASRKGERTQTGEVRPFAILGKASAPHGSLLRQDSTEAEGGPGAGLALYLPHAGHPPVESRSPSLESGVTTARPSWLALFQRSERAKLGSAGHGGPQPELPTSPTGGTERPADTQGKHRWLAVSWTRTPHLTPIGRESYHAQFVFNPSPSNSDRLLRKVGAN